MRSVAYATTGDSSVLEPTDLPIPEPGPGEVRVRLVVAGVNPTDWKARAGLTGPSEHHVSVGSLLLGMFSDVFRNLVIEAPLRDPPRELD